MTMSQTGLRPLKWLAQGSEAREESPPMGPDLCDSQYPVIPTLHWDKELCILTFIPGVSPS